MRRAINHRFRLLYALFLLPSFSPYGFAVDTNEGTSAFAQRVYTANFDLKEASDLAAKVVQTFNENQCAPIASLITPDQYDRLPPRSIAIAAYCTPTGEEAEALFARAEAAAPGDDIVLMLHARRVWKMNPTAAIPLFRKALALGGHDYVGQMAKNFLEGRGHDGPIEVNAGWIYFGSVKASIGDETNPQNLLLANQTAPSSLAALQGTAGALRSLPFGAIAANYSLSRYQYFAQPEDDLFQQDLEIPLILKAGTNEDIRLIPYGEYQFLGASPYYLYGGVRVAGIAYRGTYKQTVQASLFQDGYYNSVLERQAGSHFRFNYLWEIYPENWFLSFEAYIEHVQAGRLVMRPSVSNPGVQSIPYSHNDIVLRSAAEYNFKWMRVGVNLGFLLREDDLDSYYSPVVHVRGTAKRRQDFAVVLEPSVTVPLGKSTQLTASYKFLRLLSNMGPGDYQDLNFQNDIVTVGIRAFIESL